MKRHEKENYKRKTPHNPPRTQWLTRLDVGAAGPIIVVIGVGPIAGIGVGPITSIGVVPSSSLLVLVLAQLLLLLLVLVTVLTQ
jgi:hypothetical protein